MVIWDNESLFDLWQRGQKRACRGNRMLFNRFIFSVWGVGGVGFACAYLTP